MDNVIYKICSRAAWTEAQRAGALPPSEVDARDGFVHLSTRAQVRETAARHFAGQRDLVLLAVDVTRLEAGALRWEPSRGGALFPHLYAELRPGYVKWAESLSADESGAFVFPELE